MKEPDYQGFWDALPHISLLRSQPDLQDAFRQAYREEILGLLSMLQRVGLIWGATSLHPDPPEQCDLCGVKITNHQMFVDGSTADGAWANMCPPCFLKEGHSIGWGKGQLYSRVDDDSWRLVSGADPDAREEEF